MAYITSYQTFLRNLCVVNFSRSSQCDGWDVGKVIAMRRSASTDGTINMYNIYLWGMFQVNKMVLRYMYIVWLSRS